MTGRLAGLAAACLLVSGCSSDGTDGPRVVDAFLAEVEQGGTTALYLTIEQSGGDDRLVGVSTEVSDDVGLMAASVPMDDPLTDRSVDVELDEGEVLTWRPGGDHLMVFEVDRTLDPGDQVEVALEFDHHGTVNVRAVTLSLLELNERAAAQRGER